uniref:Transcription elongation factor 1 homolog n=1 Tax=Leersia perrieri TaxID=77586 RepID=A0A0D9WM47_9ORYZ
MGKRKSRMSKVMATAKKAAPKLETAFDCPFCNHSGGVECRIDMKHMIAEATCFKCLETYSTVAHALTEPVDVYSDWIDACHLANAANDAGDDNDRRHKTKPMLP